MMMMRMTPPLEEVFVERGCVREVRLETVQAPCLSRPPCRIGTERRRNCLRTVPVEDESILFCQVLGQLLCHGDGRLKAVSLSPKRPFPGTDQMDSTACNLGSYSGTKPITLPLHYPFNFIPGNNWNSDVTRDDALQPPMIEFREGGDSYSASLDTPGPEAFTKGQRRYDRIRVLLITWAHHDLYRFGLSLIEDEMKRVRAAFESYNYEVEEFLVPETSALLSMNRKIKNSVDDLNAAEKMNTLLILWFYGHGGLTSKSRNDLILARKFLLTESYNHERGGTWFHWTDVAKAILQVKSDVLTFLNCCHAGASLLREDQLEPFLQRN
ncbi:hypothetical protein K456DRAFT_1948394 [Colletotrichum gloeosporioides 23]|nr:hypothetical protein K456DRAFT_1948394 [Colletotrichum gloeosporioides 23]